MRKVILSIGVAVTFGMSAPAWAQSASLLQGGHASLLQGTATPHTPGLQTQSIIDKSPLVAPIPNLPQQRPSLFGGLLSMLKFPTIGSNPIASVKTRSATASPVPGPSAFQPQMPFYNK